MKSIKNCRSSFLERKDAGFSNSPYGMVHTHRKTGKDGQQTVSTPNAVKLTPWYANLNQLPMIIYHVTQDFRLVASKARPKLDHLGNDVFEVIIKDSEYCIVRIVNIETNLDFNISQVQAILMIYCVILILFISQKPYCTKNSEFTLLNILEILAGWS